MIVRGLGCLFTLIGVCVVFAIMTATGLYFAKDKMTEVVVEFLLEEVGFPAEIGYAKFDLRDYSLKFKDLHIKNPEDLGGGTFLEINTITVDKGKVEIDIKNLVYKNNHEKGSNLLRLLWALGDIYTERRDEAKDPLNTRKNALNRINHPPSILISIQNLSAVKKNPDSTQNHTTSYKRKIRASSWKNVLSTIARDFKTEGLHDMAKDFSDAANHPKPIPRLQPAR